MDRLTQWFIVVYVSLTFIRKLVWVEPNLSVCNCLLYPHDIQVTYVYPYVIGHGMQLLCDVDRLMLTNGTTVLAGHTRGVHEFHEQYVERYRLHLCYEQRIPLSMSAMLTVVTVVYIQVRRDKTESFSIISVQVS